MGIPPFDDKTFEELEPYSDDVWHFDYEAIEDHGAYKVIVEHCARLADGELDCGQVADFVDVEAGIAWVELGREDQRKRLDLHVDNDWTDPNIFIELNKRLEGLGSRRRLAQHVLGQDCLIICKRPEEIDAINKLPGLRFESVFG
jgi:hypothetical protein